MFILATTEPQKLPATILSRCQRFDFGRIPAHQIIERLHVALEEGQIQAEDAALARIARAAEGGMRDAWSIMDMCLSYAQEEDGGLTEELVLRVLGAADKSFLFAFADKLIDSDAAGALAARDEVVVEEAIARSVVFKADVVAADKSESKGVRECLNYGHTLGHAVESLAGYGAFSHGAAVAEGMRFAARMAVSLVDAPLDLVETQDSLLDQLGLPALDWSAEPEAMLEAMKRDKKARRGQVRFVLPRDVGSWQLADVDDATILDHLNAWARSKA